MLQGDHADRIAKISVTRLAEEGRLSTLFLLKSFKLHEWGLWLPRLMISNTLRPCQSNNIPGHIRHCSTLQPTADTHFRAPECKWTRKRRSSSCRRSWTSCNSGELWRTRFKSAKKYSNRGEHSPLCDHHREVGHEDLAKKKKTYKKIHDNISRGLKGGSDLKTEGGRLNMRVHRELCHVVFHPAFVNILRSGQRALNDLIKWVFHPFIDCWILIRH